MTDSCDPWSTTERRELRRLARAFVAAEIAPHMAAWEEAGQLPLELHQRAAATGILGLGFDEELGGSGGDGIDSAIVTEELLLGGGSTGVGASLFTHSIALPHLVDSGSCGPDRPVCPPHPGRGDDRRARDHRTRSRVGRGCLEDASGQGR